MPYIGTNQNTVEAFSQGYPPAVSLTAQSTVQAGASLDGLAVRANAVMAVTTSAGVSAGSVQMMGSLDNVNWFNVGSAVSTTTASTTTAVTAASCFVRFVRANIATAITGGTVTVSVGLNG
jgi:hypothetical protein